MIEFDEETVNKYMNAQEEDVEWIKPEKLWLPTSVIIPEDLSRMEDNSKYLKFYVDKLLVAFYFQEKRIDTLTTISRWLFVMCLILAGWSVVAFFLLWFH